MCEFLEQAGCSMKAEVEHAKEYGRTFSICKAGELTQGIPSYEPSHAVPHSRYALQCWMLLNVRTDLLCKPLAASVYPLISL